ncbi:MAG: hypothetical protein QW273_03315 [Candidatus Pacearchaeota archaeon]
MVKTLLELLREESIKNINEEEINSAKVIDLIGRGFYNISQIERIEEKGLRVYACDADCDNCHCATYD